MTYILIILCLLLLLFGLYLSGKNILAPFVITPAIWLVCFSLWIILSHNLPSLSNNFYLCISIWICGFTLSSTFAYSLRPHSTGSAKPAMIVRDIYLTLTVISTLFFFIWIAKVLSQDNSLNWAIKLRLASLGGFNGKAYGGIQVFLWQITYLIELYFLEKRRWYRVAIPAISYLSFSFFTMSKAGFLVFFVMTASVLIFKKGNTILKKLGIYIFILFSVFLLLQTIRAGAQTLSNKNDFIVLYALSSMSAFDTLEPGSSAHFAENIGFVIYKIAYLLKLSDIQPINPILPFIKDPIITNTYTVMYPFYVDFGLPCIALMSVFIGFLAGLIFRKATEGSSFYVILYSYFVVMIIMQYVAETFFTNMASHFRVLLLLLIAYTFTDNRKSNGRQNQ